MENNITLEMIEKAKTARSAGELLALAEESGIEMSEKEAGEYFEEMHKTGELSDDELENVAGGGCHHGGWLVVTLTHFCGEDFVCKKCSTPHCGLHAYKCCNCRFCSYEKGLWLCKNPAKRI